jgi:hypothetical protein
MNYYVARAINGDSEGILIYHVLPPYSQCSSKSTFIALLLPQPGF